MKRKAQERLQQMVEPMITRLDALAQQTDHLPTALGAVKDALDRAGIGENQRGASNAPSGGPTINIGIALGGLATAAKNAASIEGEVIDLEPEADEAA